MKSYLRHCTKNIWNLARFQRSLFSSRHTKTWLKLGDKSSLRHPSPQGSLSHLLPYFPQYITSFPPVETILLYSIHYHSGWRIVLVPQFLTTQVTSHSFLWLLWCHYIATSLTTHNPAIKFNPSETPLHNSPNLHSHSSQVRRRLPLELLLLLERIFTCLLYLKNGWKLQYFSHFSTSLSPHIELMLNLLLI